MAHYLDLSRRVNAMSFVADKRVEQLPRNIGKHSANPRHSLFAED
ncbi:hypothetical protein [Novosphingobium silvae]|nr:hypothetical protein [Novosphingobium silvae]